MSFRGITQLCLLCMSAACAPNGSADWVLDNEASSLSFVTVKAGNIGEVHTFKQLSGNVAAEHAEVEIALASVNTLIPIRDERMQELLFETQLFPSAVFRSSLDRSQIEGMAAGTLSKLTLNGQLTLKGNSVPLTAEVLVAKLSAKQAIVSSLKPVLVNASSVGLGDGVERLREIAGLPSISEAVPVSFTLSFVQQ